MNANYLARLSLSVSLQRQLEICCLCSLTESFSQLGFESMARHRSNFYAFGPG